MNPTFHSRGSFITKYNTNAFLEMNNEAVAISIITNESEKFDLNPAWSDSIQLEFEDADDRNPNCFSKDQADLLFNFISKNIRKKSIIIHCTAGVSRSAAVALFIEECMLGNEIELHRSSYYNYNRHVFKLLRNKWIQDQIEYQTLGMLL